MKLKNINGILFTIFFILLSNIVLAETINSEGLIIIKSDLNITLDHTNGTTTLNIKAEDGEFSQTLVGDDNYIGIYNLALIRDINFNKSEFVDLVTKCNNYFGDSNSTTIATLSERVGSLASDLNKTQDLLTEKENELGNKTDMYNICNTELTTKTNTLTNCNKDKGTCLEEKDTMQKSFGYQYGAFAIIILVILFVIWAGKNLKDRFFRDKSDTHDTRQPFYSEGQMNAWDKAKGFFSGRKQQNNYYPPPQQFYSQPRPPQPPKKINPKKPEEFNPDDLPDLPSQ